MKKYRIDQINEYMRHEIALFLSKTKNPKYLVTITLVEVSRDLNNANIYVSAIKLDKTKIDEREIIDFLNEYKEEIHKYLLDRLDFKRIPKLHFRLDNTAEHAMKIDKLIDNL